MYSDYISDECIFSPVPSQTKPCSVEQFPCFSFHVGRTYPHFPLVNSGTAVGYKLLLAGIHTFEKVCVSQTSKCRQNLRNDVSPTLEWIILWQWRVVSHDFNALNRLDRKYELFIQRKLRKLTFTKCIQKSICRRDQGKSGIVVQECVLMGWIVRRLSHGKSSDSLSIAPFPLIGQLPTTGPKSIVATII